MVPVLGRTHWTAAVIPRRANRPGRWTIPSLLIASVMVMTVAAIAVAAVTVPAITVPAITVATVAAITAVIIASFSRGREGRNGEDCNDNGEHSFHDSRWIWIGFE
jgi:membrane protein implicated in regulation of membrane protease activity